jgi:simple sugar transport system ATP-binding protein
MVGRAVQLRVSKETAKPAGVVLDVRDLSVPAEQGGLAVDSISFDVRGGEILGIAGVQGNGQTELCEALMGLRPSTGSVLLAGADIAGASTRERLRAGIGYVPEDRQEDGLVGTFPVAENLVLDVYDQPPYARGIAMKPDAVRKAAVQLVDEYDVRTPSVLTSAGTLSGGNQQKVVVARELSRPNKLLLASQPTRGLDVGSIEFVHSEIVTQRDQGVAVIIVSSELDEIYALSDRIAVMYEGKIVGMRAPDTSEQELGLLMTGAGSDGQPGSGTGPHSPDADEILEMPGTLDQAAPPTEEPKQ